MEQIYKCLTCGLAPLELSPKAYSCPSCGQTYPIRAGVPLFLKSVTWRDSGLHVQDAMGTAICQAMGMPPTKETIEGLREILGTNYDLPDLGLSAENNYFLERVRATLAAKGAAAMEGVPPPRPDLSQLSVRLPKNTQPRASFVHHYLPAELPPGTRLSHNVRLTNTGQSVLSSTGTQPIFIASHWRDEQGQILSWEGPRTPLVIDLLPGRSLTLAVDLKTPRHEGAAFLELTLIQEGVRWIEDSAAILPVQIRRNAKDAVPDHWRVLPTGNENYAEDHALGREMVLAELNRRGSQLRLLEVGGCCHPQMEGSGHTLYNVDIDVQTLQVGALSPRRGTGAVHFLAADAAAMPFVETSFDAVVMFATLHHFPDPVAVLSGLRPLLKPDGFLAILCEPCGHARSPGRDSSYVRELEQGINEQSFSLAEYAQIFAQAGLEGFEVVVHRSSLKAFLRPTGVSQGPGMVPLCGPEVLPSRPGLQPGALARFWSWVKRAA